MKDEMVLQDQARDSSLGLTALLQPHHDQWQTQTEIYLAAQKSIQRSQAVDALVLDGFDASPFATAVELWERLQSRPVRLVITEQDFGTGMTGLELSRKIRTRFPLP